MATLGLDSYGALPVSVLNGYDFIGRYVSGVVGKCIVQAEVTTYHRAGKSLILVYEDEAQDALGGANAGAAKAVIARPILKAIGWPTNLPVFFAVDMPGYGQYLPDFVSCAKAFAAGIARPAGIYGDVDTCTYAHGEGIEFLWQFGEGRAPGVTVYQSASTTVNGHSVDPDEALTANYGQWSPPAPPTPKPTPTEETMNPVLTTDPTNGGVIVLDTALGTYKGLSDPAVENYLENVCKIPKVPAPSAAVFAKLVQVGTI